MPWRRALPRRTSSGRAGSSLSSSAGDAPCGWRSISRTDRDRSPGRSGGCGRPSALGLRAVRPGGRATTASLRRSPEAEREVAAAIRRDLAPAVLERGPLVSVVILNRDGRDLLERCLRAVATTVYRDVEVIVVDNGSTDGSADLAESLALPFPVRVIRNAENRSFSDANDQAAAIAGGELLCFLNNDVEPITEGWLGYMVETLTTTHAAAVGARLIYPSHRGGSRAERDLPT